MTPDPREVRDAVDATWIDPASCPVCDLARDGYDRAHDPWTTIKPSRRSRWLVAVDVLVVALLVALIFALPWWAGVAQWAAWQDGLARSAAALTWQEAGR